MANPEYFRLMAGERYIGTKREVTEYLPAGSNKWQLHPLWAGVVQVTETKLTSPPVGVVAGTKRASLRKGEDNAKETQDG